MAVLVRTPAPSALAFDSWRCALRYLRAARASWCRSRVARRADLEPLTFSGRLCNNYYIMSKPAPITDLLRKTILDALDRGDNFLAMQQETGVLRQSLMKFVRGEQSLRLDMADRLADHFGLELRAKRSKRKGR
jgi:hypothetical protein